MIAFTKGKVLFASRGAITVESSGLDMRVRVVAGIASALAYFAAAKIGLLAALPVGFASVVWPSTGIALILTLRFGISAALGSAIGACAAYVVGAQGERLLMPDTNALLLLAPVGLAVVAQLLCGVALVRRFGAAFNPASPFLKMLGSGVAIAASMGAIRATVLTVVLLRSDLIVETPAASLAITLFLGDFLSTLGLLPILLLLRDSLLKFRTRSDVALGATATMMAILLISGWALTVVMQNLQMREERRHFLNQSEILVESIKEKSADDLVLLHSLEGLIELNPGLSRADFGHFAVKLLRVRPQIDRIALARRVAPEQRAAFEHSRSVQLGRPFGVSVFGSNGTMVAAPVQTNDYFPLDYIEPELQSRQSLGFDIASEPQRLQALQRSIETDEPSATGVLQLAGASHDAMNVVVFQPVMESTAAAIDRGTLQGFVAVTFSMERWFGMLMPQSGDLIRSATVLVEDVSGAVPATLIKLVDGHVLSDPPAVRPGDDGFRDDREIVFSGRHWHVQVVLPGSHVKVLGRSAWWMGQILPQLLAIIVLGTLLLTVNQARARDGLEAQLATLSRRFAAAEGDSALPRTAAPVVAANAKGPLDSVCADIWRKEETRQYYEPVIDLDSGQMIGMESLLRMPKTAGTPSTPEFIAWAERSGVIRELTRNAISEALEYIDQLLNTTQRRDLPWISVNISALDLADESFVDWVMALTRMHPQAPRFLKLEITESVLMHDICVAAERLQALRRIGLRIALDDFGTGYASLSYLRQLPLDTLKIDRSFVARVDQDLTAREIVRAMSVLARKLGLEVVAEGIEDAATAKAVQSLGCAFGQGYLFARAASTETVSEWVRNRRQFSLG